MNQPQVLMIVMSLVTYLQQVIRVELPEALLASLNFRLVYLPLPRVTIWLTVKLPEAGGRPDTYEDPSSSVGDASAFDQ